MGLPVKKADHKFTYKDYCSWPDEERWELIDGVAYDMSPAPSVDHQKILGKLHLQIGNFLKGKDCEVYLAPFDVFFPDSPDQDVNEVTTVVQPDISVICSKKKIISRGCFGPSDLIVEILSPSTMKKDLSLKFDLYQSAKVKEYWIVDPGNRFVRIYQLNDDGQYDEGTLYENENGNITSAVLAGLEITSKDIFE